MTHCGTGSSSYFVVLSFDRSVESLDVAPKSAGKKARSLVRSAPRIRVKTMDGTQILVAATNTATNPMVRPRTAPVVSEPAT